MSVALSTRDALPAPPTRRGVTVVAAWLTLAAATMLFGALLGGYFEAQDLARAADQAWPPDSVALPNVALAVAYATLAMSSITAQWALSAVGSGDRRQLYLSIGLTLLLGLGFVNALSFCWSELDLVAADGAYARHVYAVTVTHLVAVVAAHVVFVVMGFRALGGQYRAGDRDLVVTAVTIWHFVVAVGAAIWWFIWFLPGGP